MQKFQCFELQCYITHKILLLLATLIQTYVKHIVKMPSFGLIQVTGGSRITCQEGTLNSTYASLMPTSVQKKLSISQQKVQ